MSSGNIMLPKVYNGIEMDVDDWLKRYELISNINKWEDACKLASILLFLSDSALEAYRELTTAGNLTYPTMKAALSQKIVSCDSVEVAKTEFNNRSQNLTENFECFETELKRLCRRAYPQTSMA